MAISASKWAEMQPLEKLRDVETFLVKKFKNQAPVFTADIFFLKLVGNGFL